MTLLDSFPGTGPGEEPLNPQVAAGPDIAGKPGYLVEVVTSRLAIFTKTGDLVEGQSLTDFFRRVVGDSSELKDAAVAYDELAGRFIVAGGLKGGIFDVFAFAVSNDADPTHGFKAMHRFDFLRSGLAPGSSSSLNLRIGWNADAYVFTLDGAYMPGICCKGDTSCCGWNGFRMLTVDKTALDRDPFETDVNGYQSVAVATMHNAVHGDGSWLVVSPVDDPSDRTLVRVTNELSFNPILTAVAALLAAEPVPDRLYLAAPELLTLSWRKDRLVTAFTAGVAGFARAQWYEIATDGEILQSGEIGPGLPRVDIYQPAIEIATAGSLGLTFVESSSAESPAMYVTGRRPGDPLGTMQEPLRVKAGEAQYDGPAGRFGGIALDPDGTSFLAVNTFTEFLRTPHWATWIAHFYLDDAGGSPRPGEGSGFRAESLQAQSGSASGMAMTLPRVEFRPADPLMIADATGQRPILMATGMIRTVSPGTCSRAAAGLLDLEDWVD